jgi:glyoxylase-like metal-dependent hydrolase (beta-lactamase superfamily II)
VTERPTLRRFSVGRHRAIASRRRLLARAADEDIAVHAYHMPFPGLGRIRRRRDAFEWCTGA